jgi:Uncharacterized protein family UPF0004
MAIAALLMSILGWSCLCAVQSFTGKSSNKYSVRTFSRLIHMHSPDAKERSQLFSVPVSLSAKSVSADDAQLTADALILATAPSSSSADKRSANSNKKFFIETHGCQMNLADSEVIRSVLLTEQYVMCDVLEDADLILTNTCSIR